MTDKHPLVSVLISTYNNEQTISDAVESIINQTYRKIEILIMDDSSTDSTSKILNDYSKKYEHVRVFTNTKNIGLTKSLNILLGKAEGELIARHDADDVSLEDRISIQVKEILDNYLDFCSTRAYVKDKNRITPGTSFYIPKKIVLKIKNPFIHGSLMIRKNVIIDAGCYSEDFYYAQDYELMLRLIRLNYKFKILRKPYYILNTQNNISSIHADEQKYFAKKARDLANK